MYFNQSNDTTELPFDSVHPDCIFIGRLRFHLPSRIRVHVLPQPYTYTHKPVEREEEKEEQQKLPLSSSSSSVSPLRSLSFSLFDLEVSQRYLILNPWIHSSICLFVFCFSMEKIVLWWRNEVELYDYRKSWNFGIFMLHFSIVCLR